MGTRIGGGGGPAIEASPTSFPPSTKLVTTTARTDTDQTANTAKAGKAGKDDQGTAVRPVPLDDKRSRALFVLKSGLIIGSCICLAVLLLLALARIKKREMEEKDAAAPTIFHVRKGKIVSKGEAGGKGSPAAGHSVLGILAVPVSIITVAIAGFLVLQYEREVIARQRSRQNSWNWMKVGMICVIVGLGPGLPKPETLR